MGKSAEKALFGLIVLVVIAGLLIGGFFFIRNRLGETYENHSVVFVVGPRRNSRTINFNNNPVLDSILHNVTNAYGFATIVVADGVPANQTDNVFDFSDYRPSIITRILAPNSVSDLLDEMQDTLRESMLNARAREEQADILEAITIAARILSARPDDERKEIVVLGTGLSTSGWLNFTDYNNWLFSDAAHMIETLQGRGNLPNLDGITVTWFQMHDVAEPQPILPGLQRSNLEQIWRLIVMNSGAIAFNLENVHPGDGVFHEHFPPSGLPYVSIVEISSLLTTNIQIYPPYANVERGTSFAFHVFQEAFNESGMIDRGRLFNPFEPSYTLPDIPVPLPDYSPQPTTPTYYNTPQQPNTSIPPFQSSSGMVVDIWIEGGSHPGTYFNGFELVVAIDDHRQSITIVARLNISPNVYAYSRATVQLVSTPVVDVVSILPEQEIVLGTEYPFNSLTLTAIVHGSNNPSQHVHFQLFHNTDPNTRVDSNGNIFIAPGETSTILTVRVTSGVNPSVYTERVIRVRTPPDSIEVWFVSGSAVFANRAEAINTVREWVDFVNEQEGGIFIFGCVAHTGRGTTENAVRLGLDRANAVRDIFINYFNIPSYRITTRGLGYNNPWNMPNGISGEPSWNEQIAASNRIVVIMSADDAFANRIYNNTWRLVVT